MNTCLLEGGQLGYFIDLLPFLAITPAVMSGLHAGSRRPNKDTYTAQARVSPAPRLRAQGWYLYLRQWRSQGQSRPVSNG